MIIYFILMQILKEAYPSFVSISSKIDVKIFSMKAATTMECHVEKRKRVSQSRDRESNVPVSFIFLYKTRHFSDEIEWSNTFSLD